MNLHLTRSLLAALAASLLLGAAGSCRMFGPSAPTWHYGIPAAKGVWARKIADLDYRAARLQDVVADLERKANAGGGPQVSIRLCEPESTVFTPVTFQSRALSLSDALNFLSGIAHASVRYADHTVEFVPAVRGAWTQSVTCTGRLTDARTGRPLERAVMTTDTIVDFCYPLAEFTVTTNGDYAAKFLLGAERSGTTPEPFLRRLALQLELWAPDYEWAKRELDIQPTNYVYRLDVALTPRPLDFGRLADLALRHGIPMPPPGARLVLARRPYQFPVAFSPAYLLEEKQDGSIVVLRGLDREELKQDKDRSPLWLPFSFDGVVPGGGDDGLELNSRAAFVCAVQTADAGREDIARGIWKRFAVAGRCIDASPYEDITPQLRAPELLLGRCAFEQLTDRLLQGPEGWKEIQDRMAAWFEDVPELRTRERRELCRNLAAAVDARPAPLGSVEAQLVDWSRRPHTTDDGGLLGPEQLRIVGRGYEAVPELLRLMKDRRITAHGFHASMHCPARVTPLGTLAYDLACYIAGEHPPPDTDGEAALRAWWSKTRRKDEVSALMETAFSREGGRIVRVNDGPVHLLAVKYPAKLAGLCEEFSSQAAPEAWAETLAWELSESGLPKETRIRQLSEFAQRGPLAQRQAFLGCLARLDPKACVALLMPVLRTLPQDATGPYWTCPEARLAYAVVQLDDIEVCREYLHRARESTPALRMEIMNSMSGHSNDAPTRQRQLAFLAAFLDDESVRVIPEGSDKFEGPCAGGGTPRMVVRDLATVLLASMLELDYGWSWADIRWAELRARVKERLAKEALPEL